MIINNEINNLNKRNLNSGIEILRVLLCLWVVITHCSHIKEKHFKYLKKGYHVPTFILLSFYFYYQVFNKRIQSKIIARFEKLLIPYIFWPTILLIINNFLFYKMSVGKFKKFTLKELYVQILLGAGFYIVFWFQFNLLFLSLFFTIISFLYKKKSLNIFKVLGIISFYLNISGINVKFFNSFDKTNIVFRQNLGSLFELIPQAVIGCIYSSSKLIMKIKFNSKYSYFLLSSMLIIIFEFELFVCNSGFRYPNSLDNFFASTILILLFSSLSFEKYKNKSIRFIRYITQFTGGIYYTHTFFFYFLKRYSNFFFKKSYSTSFVIYIICYIFCFLGNSLFKNNKLKYLFI